jgi:hypothetical protein
MSHTAALVLLIVVVVAVWVALGVLVWAAYQARL